MSLGCTLHPLPYCHRTYPCHQAVRYTPCHIVTANTRVIRLYATPLAILSPHIPVSSGRTLLPLPYCHRKYPCHQAVRYSPCHIVTANTRVIRPYATPLAILSPPIPVSSGRTLHPLPYCHANTRVIRLYATPLAILSPHIPVSSGRTLLPLPYCHRKYPCHQAVRYTPCHIVTANSQRTGRTHTASALKLFSSTVFTSAHVHLTDVPRLTPSSLRQLEH